MRQSLSPPAGRDGSSPATQAPTARAAAPDLHAPPGNRTRRLHAGHFAFMRAVVQGVDVTAAWDRYLRVEGESSDARAVRSTMAWIRDEFAAAAQRHARYGVARLVRLDSARLDAGAQTRVPALEDFAVERGLEDFSQAEQLEVFEAEYRQVLRRTRRRERLIQRQLEALAWLESLAEQPQRARRAIPQPPRASDPVDVWINPLLARHLQRAGLATLGQLVERINGIGRRWYAPIQGLGPVKAERILSWLRNHEASIAGSGAASLGGHVDRPRSQVSRAELAAVLPPATAMRPLEKLVIPAALDGSRGSLRRPQGECLLAACNDIQAVLAWLESKAAVDSRPDGHAGAGQGVHAAGDIAGGAAGEAKRQLSHTQRAYRKEAERLLLWAIIERQKPLSGLSVDDCAAYRAFIADPQPRERWCAPRSRERWSPLWRPFEGPLSMAAQRQAVRILGNLFAFLTRQNYLAANPWAGVGMPQPDEPHAGGGRSFTVAQWHAVRRQLASLPDSGMNRRLRFALELLYATGMRLSEAVAATVDDLRWVEYGPAQPDPERSRAGWRLVVGRGARTREVPVPAEVVDLLGRSLAARGQDADPLHRSNRGAFMLAPEQSPKAPRPRRTGAVVSAASRPPGPIAIGPGRPGEGSYAAAGLATGQAGLAPNTLATQLKRFFIRCADALAAAGDVRGAERLRGASTHWLRNTHNAHALASSRTPIRQALQDLAKVRLQAKRLSSSRKHALTFVED